MHAQYRLVEFNCSRIDFPKWQFIYWSGFKNDDFSWLLLCAHIEFGVSFYILFEPTHEEMMCFRFTTYS